MYENMNTPSAKIFNYVTIIFCLVAISVCILPIFNVVSMSVSSPDAILRGEVFFLPKGINFASYKKLLSSGAFFNSMRYSLYITIIFTVVSMFMTVLCAYPLSKGYLKGRSIFMIMIVFTMYFDAGIVPNYLLIKDMNLLNKTASLILPGMLSAYNMIILRNFFSNIDGSILESAQIDGCSEFGLLFRIVLPLSGAVIATLSLFYAVSRWNGVSDAIYYISDPKKYPLQSILKEIILSDQVSALDVGQSQSLSKTVAESTKAASVVIATIPILLIYPFAQKYFTKGIMLGSVKG